MIIISSQQQREKERRADTCFRLNYITKGLHGTDLRPIQVELDFYLWESKLCVRVDST